MLWRRGEWTIPIFIFTTGLWQLLAVGRGIMSRNLRTNGNEARDQMPEWSVWARPRMCAYFSLLRTIQLEVLGSIKYVGR